MLSHPIKLISKFDPLKYLLSRTSLTSCMANWVMLLRKFDIEYIDHKEIKGKIITNHLVNAPLVDAYPLLAEFFDEEVFTVAETNTWMLYFDGSYTHNGAGVGVLFVTPQGYYNPKSFKLAFPCTNNIEKYEAPITSLRIAI